MIGFAMSKGKNKFLGVKKPLIIERFLKVILFLSSYIQFYYYRNITVEAYDNEQNLSKRKTY